MKDLSSLELRELKDLYSDFSLSNWIELSKGDSLLSRDYILNQLLQTLKNANCNELDEINKDINTLMESQAIGKEQNELIKNINKTYWTKLFNDCPDSQKLQFLIFNSKYIERAFLGDEEGFKIQVNKFFRSITHYSDFFNQFVNKIDIFINSFDNEAQFIKQYFTDTNFFSLNDTQQIKLFIALNSLKITLNIELQAFIFNITQCRNIESIFRVFTILIESNPFLNYLQPLIKIFINLSNTISDDQIYKFMEYKNMLLQLANQILLQQQKSNQNKKNEVKNDNEQKGEQIDEVENKLKIPQPQLVILQEDINVISTQMEEIITNRLIKLSIEDILICLDKLSNENNIQNTVDILKKVIIKQIEQKSYNSELIVQSYNKAYQKFLYLNQRKESYEYQIMYMILEQFEQFAISKFHQNYQINNHYYEETTHLYLTLPFITNTYKNLVLKDLEMFIPQINNIDIDTIQKLLSSKPFERIFNFFQQNLQIHFDQFKQQLLYPISIYQTERQKLNKFFQRFKSYLASEYKIFEELFTANQIFIQIDPILCKFTHLQIMYEFYYLLSDSIVFKKILLLVEEGQKEPKEMTFESLQVIFKNLQESIITMVTILTQDNSNNDILKMYQIQSQQKEDNQNSKPEQQDSVVIIQKLQKSQINLINFNLFPKNIITIQQLRNLCGNRFEESLNNINTFLGVLKANYSPTLIEDLLKCTYYQEFLYSQGKILLSLAKIYGIETNSRESSEFNLHLQKLVGQQSFGEQSIQSFISQKSQAQGEIATLVLMSDSLDEQMILLEKLEVILNYMNTNLKLTTFLDLRELVDEDNTDVISLLIKLNNYSNLFLQLQELKVSMAKVSFSTFIKSIIQFLQYHITNSQIILDLNDCVNNFEKISKISQTFDKQKQSISLTCQILDEGIITLKLDQNNSNLVINIKCNKEYSEQEMRQICSKVILEQTTTTNILIAAAQANVEKRKMNQLNQLGAKQQIIKEYQNVENYKQVRNQFSLQSKSIGGRSFDDAQVFTNNNKEEEEELQQEICLIKSKMKKFRDQWFMVEQLKDILLELAEYGNYGVLKQELTYDNRNNQYQNMYQKMQNNYDNYKKILTNWRQQLETIYQSYPHFSLVGYIHYRELIQIFCGYQIAQQLSSDLQSLLKFLGNTDQDIQLLMTNTQNKTFIQLEDHQKLTEIAKRITSKASSNNQISLSKVSNNYSNQSVCQVKYNRSKQLIEILMNKVQNCRSSLNFYQFFYCDQHSKIQDLELFLYRYQYLFLNGSGSDYFIIFHKQINLKFCIKAIELLQQTFKNQKMKENTLYILINREIQFQEISIIPNFTAQSILSQVKQGQQYSEQFESAKKLVQFVYSEYPGAGKTFYIQQEQQKEIYQRDIIRIPTNGSGDKLDFLELVREKTRQGKKQMKTIHMDLYEQQDKDINYLLFELIFLRSVSIHSNKFIYLEPSIRYFIEIQNSLGKEFFNQLTIKEYFNQKAIEFNIKAYQIRNQNLSFEDKQIEYICYKYLSVVQQCLQMPNYLDKVNLSEQKYKENDTSYQDNFQNLFENLFIKKLQAYKIQPCFYQLRNFIQLFGSEMIKFEQCVYLDHHILQRNQNQLLDLGIRSKVLLTSFNLCLEVSINKQSNSNQKQNEGNLSKEQLLHNKAQSIEKFNSCMMNFITFQEQENPCITTFFDKTEQVPECIKQLFQTQKENMIFFDQQNRPEALLKWLIMLIHQNVSYMYGDPKSIEYTNICHDELQKTVKRITIQKDNFFKIAMIFMRIRSNTPVIIMGQSGIGKTALIEVMSLIMDAQFYTMNVHAGLTERDVINFINTYQISIKPTEKVILFFDEVNTNKLVGGLFKEILVDRCIKGNRINRNIIPIAAINPYKLKSEQQKKMINLQIHGGIKKDIVDRIKNTDLEYMVEPIPESMYSFIWNFDSLDKVDEKCYIQQMVIIKNQIKIEKLQYKKFQFSNDQLTKISNTIFFAQETIRKEMGYQSACSLRDVSRFNKLLFWFVRTLQIFQKFGLQIESIPTYSMCLSFFINYAVRLPLAEQRRQFMKDCSQNLSLKENYAQQVVHQVLTFLINQAEVPQGIVKNTALKSNVFTLFVSIMNKIPVVLIGPPGCSKSLSLSILIKSMKGEQSKSSFFQQFKAIMQLFYQGHIQSTSERILEVFEKAKEEQRKIVLQKQQKKYLSLVQIEEIGLAEISPHNPLKVLHSTLEKPTIAVACISNWPLDQSKMNRMLTVYRLNINQDELSETVQCIQQQIASTEKDQFIIHRLNQTQLSSEIRNEISQIYLRYMALLKNTLPKHEQFHGLRDFYAMSKLLCQQQLSLIKNNIYGRDDLNYTSQSNELRERIMQCYLRHFSGLKESRSLLQQTFQQIYTQHYYQGMNPQLQSDLQLIEDNLLDKSDYYISRHLMIITENPQCAAEYISRKLSTLKKPYKLLLGSDFSNDQSSENSSSIINQIISCVESGIVVIIQNLDKIYQSLYELLNQNYREINGKPYCKISFGADYSNIQVADGFKLILLAHHSQIHRMDGPLLNRFEKHIFEESMTLNNIELKQIQVINQYFEQPQLADIFNFSNVKEVVQSLVIQQSQLSNNKSQVTDIIQIMYRLISLSKSLTYADQQDEVFKKNYVNSQLHFNLQEFIKRRILQNENNQQNDNNSSRLITIYSPSYCLNLYLESVQLKINLSEIDSQQKLCDLINKFFKQKQREFVNQDNQKSQTILVIGDLNYDSIDRIILVRQRIQEAFSLLGQTFPQNIAKNFYVILTIRTNDQYTLLPFSGSWEQYYLEDLFPLSFVSDRFINLKELFNVQNIFQKQAQLFLNYIKIDEFIDYFISQNENITNSYRNVNYKQVNREGFQQTRLSQLWELFSERNQKLSQLQSLFLQISKVKVLDTLSSQGVKTVDDFIHKHILQKKFVQQTQSLAHAIWYGLNDIVQQAFSLIIYILEKNNLVYSIYYSMNNSEIINHHIQKILSIFQLSFDQFDFNTGQYRSQIEIKNFSNLTKFEIDENTKDLQYCDSEKFYSLIGGIISKLDTISTGLTINNQQNQLKSTKFQEACIQVEQSLKELMQENDLNMWVVFYQQFFNDFYRFSKQNVTQFQRDILLAILGSPHYNFKKEEGDQENMIKQIVFNHFFSNDLIRIEHLLNQFKVFITPENVFINFITSINQHNKGTLRDFLDSLVKSIHQSIQPSEKLFKTIKEKKIDFEGEVIQLVQFIDLYQLQAQNNEILSIKQELLLLQCFIQDIISSLHVNLKLLNFIDLQFFQDLDQHYLKDLKTQLKSLSKMNLQQQSVILSQGENINEIKMNQQEELRFEEKWNTFLLELMHNSVKCREREYQPKYTRSLFDLMSQIEKSYQKRQQQIPHKVLIKLNLIMNELTLSINTEDILMEIFQNDQNNPLVQNDSTEYSYLVIFSNSLQQNIIKPLVKQINSQQQSNFIIPLLYNCKFEVLTQIQKLIYLAIFRHVIFMIIDAINSKGAIRVIDYDLKSYFDNMQQSYFRFFIAKAFYNEYKNGEEMSQKMKQSPYFKDNKWLQKYTEGFKGLLSSSFFDELQMKRYRECFENKQATFKILLKDYLSKYLNESNNAFGSIFKGNLNINQFYPYMMSNNIYLFHRDSSNNKQLYQCTNCQEFIFSNACPDLQSKLPCLQCGLLIALRNGNTKQVLKYADQHQQQLEEIKKAEQWKGFYIRLEEDTPSFKLDQGSTLDLRIFALLYYYCILLAFEKNKQYQNQINMRVYNPRQNQEVNATTLQINKLLRIHYEADPVKFINDQIDIAYNHIINIMNTSHNISENEATIIIFKFVSDLLNDNSIQPTQNQQQREQINTQLSQHIQQVIQRSQKALLDSKSEYVAVILEKDQPNKDSIKNQYLINLRAAKLNIQTSFIQQYIKDNLKNDQFKILKLMLDIEKITYISDALKSLIYFTQQINQLFMKQFSKKKTQEITLLQALGNNRNHPLYLYYTKRIIPVWAQIKEKEVVYYIGCKVHEIVQIDEKTKLNHLLFTDDKPFGYFPNILELIVQIQNNFLNNIHQFSLAENPKEFHRLIKQIETYLIDPAQQNENKFKELTIQHIDVERNIIKKFNSDIYASYFMSDLEYSNGFNYIQDFQSLQEELVQQVFNGAVQINLQSSQKFFFLSEIHQIGLLSNIAIEQEKIPVEIKQRLIQSFQNKTQVFELLSQLSTVFQIFKQERNQGNLSILSAIQQLQIRQQNFILSEIKLYNLNDTISCLEELYMDDLVEFCNPVYQVPLSQNSFEVVIQFINKTVKIDNFRIALGRFILRCLSQESDSINADRSLFEQLFYLEIYEELWNDPSKVEVSYDEANRHKLTIGQSYDLYKKTNNLFKRQSKSESINYKNINNISHENNQMIMENFTDQVFKSNLKDQFK